MGYRACRQRAGIFIQQQPASLVAMESRHGDASTATYAAFTTPVAAIRLTMNALSSTGGKVTATILQAGIG